MGATTWITLYSWTPIGTMKGSGLETVPWSKRGNDGEEEMGFGLMSWHTHHSLNGQRWQGSIIVECAASLLPVAVT